MKRKLNKIIMMSLAAFTVVISAIPIKAEEVLNPPVGWAFNESSRNLELAIINNPLTAGVDANKDGYITIEEANNSTVRLYMLSSKNINSTLDGIEHLTNALIIDLANNQIHGSIPSDIGKLKKLSTLGLFRNDLTGHIPDSLSQMTNLTQVKLNENNLTGSIPENIGDLSKLIRFDVEHNNLTGELPTSMSNLSKIESIDLRYNNLIGELPDISAMPSIQSLFVSHNNFSGQIPDSYGLNTSLINIDVHDNTGLLGITEDIFVSNTGLKYLDVRHTMMSQIKPNLPTLDSENGGFFAYDLMNAEETNILDFVTQEILDESELKFKNIGNPIARNDYEVYVKKASAMYDAKIAVEALLVAPEYTALTEEASYELLEVASDLVDLVVDGELKDELKSNLVMIVDMLDATFEVDSLFDDQNNFLDDLYQVDINEAKTVVDALHESATKDELMERIKRAQTQFEEREDAIKKTSELFDENGLIFDEVILKDVLEAEEAVLKLPEGPLKTELLIHIDDAKRQVNEREYKIVKDFDTYTGKETMSATIDGPHHLLSEVLVNNELMDVDDYIVTEGSTVVTLKDSYVKTLKNGDYDIQFNYRNEETVSSNLKVDVKIVNPITGLSNPIYLLLAVVAASAIVLLVLKKKKIK